MEYVKHENNIPFQKHKLLDLRTMERFAKFDMFKCIYKAALYINILLLILLVQRKKRKG